MKIDHAKIGRARDALSPCQLNDAEQLLLCKRLLEGVFSSLEPLTDPQMCIAEGYLCSAVHSVDQAQQLVETWPHANLPGSFEELDEQVNEALRPVAVPEAPPGFKVDR